jgi:hypothetical protein
MSVMGRQAKEMNNLFTEQSQKLNEQSTKSLGKRSILDEQELEWYFEDLVDDISSNLVKRGSIQDSFYLLVF